MSKPLTKPETAATSGVLKIAQTRAKIKKTEKPPPGSRN
jgi:hypothetical protein